MNGVSTYAWHAYRIAKSEEEIHACGLVRRRAYAAAGKAPASADPFLDACDHAPGARLLYWTSPRGDVVATCRLHLPTHADERLDCDLHVPRPATVPPWNLIGEASRIAIDPQAHGQGLLLSSGMAMCLELLRARRRWLYVCAAGSLVPLYERLGFRCLDTRFDHAGLNGVNHDLLLGHVPESMLYRIPLSKRVWAKVHAPVLQQALREGLLSPTPFEQSVLGAISKPIAWASAPREPHAAAQRPVERDERRP